jgi:anaerobic selenocysteine-containing dehydrogenase
MGFNDQCFLDDDFTLCKQAFAKTLPQMSFDDLLQVGFYSLDFDRAPYANGNFHTPSQRFEFYSDRLDALGHDPLPTFIANAEPANVRSKYPLAMISPPARNFLNSTFVNVDSVHQHARKDPYIEIHPEDAKKRNLTSDSLVEVFNDRGSYVCQVSITERTQPGLIVGLGIWWRKDGVNGTNVNELTSQTLTDIGNGPTFYDCAVEVRTHSVTS